MSADHPAVTVVGVLALVLWVGLVALPLIAQWLGIGKDDPR